MTDLTEIIARLTELTDDELTELRQQVTDERSRRSVIASVEREAEILSQRYQEAIGRQDGDEWVQPTSAIDAYQEGSIVTHEGMTWVSLHGANVHAPGASGWREVVEEGDAPAEWVAPSGAHDAYQIGDQVSFEGKTYESVIDANVHSPSAYPQGWKEL